MAVKRMSGRMVHLGQLHSGGGGRENGGQAGPTQLPPDQAPCQSPMQSLAKMGSKVIVVCSRLRVLSLPRLTCIQYHSRTTREVRCRSRRCSITSSPSPRSSSLVPFSHRTSLCRWVRLKHLCLFNLRFLTIEVLGGDYSPLAMAQASVLKNTLTFDICQMPFNEKLSLTSECKDGYSDVVLDCNLHPALILTDIRRIGKMLWWVVYWEIFQRRKLCQTYSEN